MFQPNSPLSLEILDHLPQGVFIVRRDGIVCFWSQCLVDWTDIPKGTIEGTSLESHFPHLGTPKYTSRFEPLFAGGAPATFASQFHPQFLPCSLSSGQPRIQQTIAKTIWDEPTQEWHALIIIQDISDLHRQVVESQRLRKQAQAEVIERKKVETTLADHNRSLSLDAEIGRITNQDTNFQSLLQHCTQAMVDHLNVAFARIWTVDSTQQFLELRASAGLYTHLNGPHGRIPIGQFKIGQIAAEKKPHLTNSVIGDPRVSDQEWAKREGMIAFAGYPLFQGEEILGVMAVFSRHPLTELTLDTLRMVADRMTLAIERQNFLQTNQDLSLRYERILSSVGEGIFGLDLEGRTTFANPAAAQMLGYEPEELIGIPMHSTVHHTHSDGSPYPREDCPMYSALKDGAIHHIEDEVLWRKDGSSFPIDYSSRPIHDEHNQFVGAVVTFKDITELKQMEKAQADLQRAIDQGVEGVALLDQNGIYTYVNQAHAGMYGYITKELLGQSWEILYSKEQLAYIDDKYLPQLRNTGKWEGELMGLRKDGTSFPVEISLSLLNNQNGSSADLICTCRDMTERKKAEEQFRLVVEAAPSGMIMIDRHGSIVLVNQLVTQLFGYPREELLNQSIELLVPERFRAQHPEHRTGFFADPRPRAMGSGRELFGLRKDGSEFPVELGLNPLVTGDETFVLASVVDITERKKTESVITQTTQALEQQNLELAETRDEALAAARSKSSFLATMSHEIRTPLNGVIGMTDLLLDTGLDADQRDMVDTVKNSGEFLLTIINDILDFSKIDAGKLDLEIIHFDIRKAVDDVLDILAERASQKNLELIGLIYASTPLQLQGDPGRIRQVLFNLLGNAIKFTHDGEIVIDVSVIETTRDTTTLRFAVTDTGIGIAHETQQRLFDSFTQADSSTTRKFGGTGLGLAISKQLVTLMQGEIGVISEKGHGSTFWFTIPLAHSSTSSTTPVPNITMKDRRVCIVESNDTIRFLLQHYAESWGMICEVTPNGREGLALIQQRAKEDQSFDVAILDHTFSEAAQEDGLSLAKHIRQDTKIPHIPLILLTALGKRGEGKLAQHAGFNGYLTKPIRHQQLQQCLQMILGDDQQTTLSTSNQPSALITRHTVEEAQAQTHAHILLAEDNVVNQKVAVRMLQKIGYRVDVVENGQEVIDALERTSYDLVLMDCQMPEMDGLEATRKIREGENLKREAKEKISPDALPLTHHEKSRVPIIALTANALSGDRETCLEAGMDDFLTKPVRIEDLRAMTHTWLPQPIENNSEDQHMAEHTRKNPTTVAPSLDETILNDLKALGGDDDHEFFLTLVDQFLEDLPRHLEGIQEALEHQDCEALVKAAHTCKGSERSIGATCLADISYTLESMGREGNLEDANEKLAQWLQEQERTTQALQEERNQATAEVKREKEKVRSIRKKYE